jgi:serine/threonine-protein kinase
MSQLHFGSASPYPLPGEVLDGKYRIERLLGEGEIGAVAKAIHLLRRAPVALKFMNPGLVALVGAVERFVNEGLSASRIDSDHVVKVFDVGRMPNGAPYLVMEYLEGYDVGQLMANQEGGLETARAVHLVLQMLRALQTAHAAGIIHRNMKPANCFVIEKDGEADFVKVVDFGFSRVRTEDAAGRSAQLTRNSSALRTPLFMSPEQARSLRDVDHRADLYSVGAILYEMLSGRTPYAAESGEYKETLCKRFTTEPAPLVSLRPELAPALCEVVHRALLRDREARFATAYEMAEALAPFAGSRSATVLARLRAGHVRSSTLSPSGQVARIRAEAMRALSFPASSEALRPPRVPTDFGVAREAHSGLRPAAPGGARALPWILAAIAAIGMIAAALGIAIARAR